MNERSENKGRNWKLLLIPVAAIMVAKGAKRRRAMWASGSAAPGGGGHRFGHHRNFEGGFGPGFAGRPGTTEGFRLPPKIESMLETWHSRAHQATEATETETV